MTIEEQVLEKLRRLPPERQKEVLDFVNRLKDKGPGSRPRRRLAGLWADLNISLGADDIAEARRELWNDFPREMS